MVYKNQMLTFRKDQDFDPNQDMMIAGDNSIIKGKCIEYGRSGWHRTWKIIDKDGVEQLLFNTFDTLVAVNGKAV